ncbi:putative membrane protein (TIGR01666 family) [Mucilaginibacter yixingensis]|uniref:Putative membrane protein (TIGR01666 family) n=1 Tax=Mucilaginibacter yixingensis TaxID=1295612 RepID=A0A2T5J9P3_9SPHI|nr:FUSC family membrane protein [Mucilaginibacter yixingensis]PTQ96788.1 putative membrane protein (TIGR01666 family) [Mucilaginibacter yixingensis]
MNLQTREIKNFFYSQYFSDGLRMSMGILVPTLLFAQLNLFDVGLTLSLGALCVCVVDTPGPTVYKRNAMAICNLCIFVVAMVTGFARLNLYTLGVEILVFSFVFSMLAVYGNRAAAVGTAALLVMIFMMDKALKPEEVPDYCLILLAGGVWYMLQSLLFFRIRPYRAAQQALGENILDVVKFLRIKADFYKEGTDIDDNYRKLVSTQIQVSQHQDTVREILFKSRVTVKESTYASRLLVMTFGDLVDLYEQIMATHYDYQDIHEKFGSTGILTEIAGLLQQMADELDNIGVAILANSRYKHAFNFDKQLEQIKLKIDEIGKEESVSNLVLKKILINLRDLNRRITDIFNYYHTKSSVILMGNRNDIEYVKFVSHQDYNARIFTDNLSFSSATFKHALRVALVCITGFIITKSAEVLILADFVTGRKLVFGHHSYWVLLTIIVILKPGFSLSKQRNYQRLVGTVIGGIIGAIILYFLHNTVAEFILLTIFMIGSYSFVRLNYVISVLFTTPYVLILFKFLGVGHVTILQERIIDTILGSVIAFIASYLVFPSWESEQLIESLRDVIYANANYLAKIATCLNGANVNTTEFKLARKDVYVKSANLSAAFERMTSEPKRKQRKSKDVHKFVVLNHILSSYLATIASNIKGNDNKLHSEHLKLVRRSLATLNESEKLLGGPPVEFTADKPAEETADLNTDEKLLREQLGFINKVSYDIAKVTEGYLN